MCVAYVYVVGVLCLLMVDEYSVCVYSVCVWCVYRVVAYSVFQVNEYVQYIVIRLQYYK